MNANAFQFYFVPCFAIMVHVKSTNYIKYNKTQTNQIPAQIFVLRQLETKVLPIVLPKHLIVSTATMFKSNEQEHAFVRPRQRTPSLTSDTSLNLILLSGYEFIH